MSWAKGAAMVSNEGLASLSVTHFTPGSEQMDRYDLGPDRVSVSVIVLVTGGTNRDIPSLTSFVLDWVQ